ncbi:VOC family protein [Mycobacterium aquaticum]|uniref:VOC domain-containing protein n=1 Tax=Mycobacterium aquaticum TaxID=1927124 RepID=A0A1X0A8D1_9MYCO|nr:VOC family protein [Mycobacterium aquaticum]ORA26293.1 hypothetical protein BST13_32050 [Mycobacterium aquaticum]
MIDHVYISVSDVEKSRKLYGAVLKLLGWREFGEYTAPQGIGVPDLYGFSDKHHMRGEKIGTSVWLRQSSVGASIYLGLVAGIPRDVDTAYAAAIKAGARDAGGPALRDYFGPGYYAANIIDFDGNEIEIVNKSGNPSP